MQHESAAFVRVRFGRELRALREAAHLSLDEAAALLPSRRSASARASASKISRIETGKRGATLNDQDEVRTLLRGYHVTDEDRIERLVDMWHASTGPDWWDKYADLLPDNAGMLMALEGDARTARVFETVLIPGLLQTEAYMKALYGADRTHSPDEADQLVELRLERQRVLTRQPRPLEVQAIVDEAAVRRLVGGRQAMREQIEHLIRLGRGAHPVTIQIITFEGGANVGQNGPFTILDQDDESTVYLEQSALYLSKPRVTGDYNRKYELLIRAALNPEQSLELLDRITKEM